MPNLQFDTEIIKIVADHRNEVLSAVFGFSNFFGEVEGIILVVAGIYVMYDKKLAVRISVIALVTMILNHLIKLAIQNPRPFVVEGTYLEDWEVSQYKAEELVEEFSTPSGHAMVGAAFYGYLAVALKNRFLTAVAIVVILFVGLARPYLGVHYFEDILLGWMIGAVIVFVMARHIDILSKLWGRLSHLQQVLVTVGLAVIVWLLSFLSKGGDVNEMSIPYLGYLGFLTGIAIAHPIEISKVRFDPRSASPTAKILRLLICVGFVMVPVITIDQILDAAVAASAPIEHLIYYGGYVLTGILGFLVAPVVFLKLGLATTDIHTSAG